MKASISEIVGRAEDAQGKEVPVYRALRPLLCARCGAEIKEGSLFTRGKLAGIRLSPACGECLPFGALRKEGTRSPLLDSLLGPEPSEGKAAKHAGAADGRLISKEVERRLGPVLARCRRRRR